MPPWSSVIPKTEANFARRCRQSKPRGPADDRSAVAIFHFGFNFGPPGT